MENTLNSGILRTEVKNLTSGIDTYLKEQYDRWETKTKRWVASKREKLLSGGDRERLVEEINKDTPRQLLEQLSNECPIKMES